MIKGYLFDMDGTLLNSMGVWDGFADEYLERYGKQPEEHLDSILSVQALDTSAVYVQERYQIPKTPDEILQEWEDEMCKRYHDRVTIKKGALEFLAASRKKGIKMSIITSNGRRILDTMVEKYHLDAYMEETLTAPEVGLEKTDPQLFTAVAKRLGLEPQECVVFEDSLHAMESAKAAGFHVVGLAEPLFVQNEQKVKEIVDRYILDFSELL